MEFEERSSQKCRVEISAVKKEVTRDDFAKFKARASQKCRVEISAVKKKFHVLYCFVMSLIPTSFDAQGNHDRRFFDA